MPLRIELRNTTKCLHDRASFLSNVLLVIGVLLKMLRQTLSSGASRPLLSAQQRQGGTCIRRTFWGGRSRGRSRRAHRAALDTLNIERMGKQMADYHNFKRAFLIAGAIAGAITALYTSCRIVVLLAEQNQDKTKQQKPKPGVQLDSALGPDDPLNHDNRKVVKHDEDGREIVPTGNSTVPEFPRTIQLPDFAKTNSSQPIRQDTPNTVSSVAAPTLIVAPAADSETEYTLVGLGTRSVSFLGINVYVLGYYVATADIAELQARLVKKINPIASTLVSTEKDDLRKKLLDAAEGEQVWDELLSAGVPARSMIRIVPVRDTDFPHLRDGFVRAIQARAGNAKDEQFGQAMKDFRQAFNRGKVPKRKELLLLRDKQGRLTMVYDDGKTQGKQVMGTIDDERISRALWMNYLAGKNVASEEARKNIVHGIMEFAERPIGTVAAQVL